MIACRREGIGSLLRPTYLAQARQRFERGEIGPSEFERIEDRAVDEP
jgi:5-methyltetrahydropteroyltriglutamate--homocysteine methyltransferase